MDSLASLLLRSASDENDVEGETFLAAPVIDAGKEFPDIGTLSKHLANEVTASIVKVPVTYRMESADIWCMRSMQVQYIDTNGDDVQYQSASGFSAEIGRIPESQTADRSPQSEVTPR